MQLLYNLFRIDWYKFVDIFRYMVTSLVSL